jgi:hypothetical protein
MGDLLSGWNRAELWILLLGTPILILLLRDWTLCMLPFEMLVAVRQYIRLRALRRHVTSVGMGGKDVPPPTTEWGWFRYQVVSNLRGFADEYGGERLPVKPKDLFIVLCVGIVSLGAWVLLAEVVPLPRAMQLLLGVATWVVWAMIYICQQARE